MSDLNEQKIVTEGDEAKNLPADIGLIKALDTYKKLIEVNTLTEKQQDELEKKIKEIESREIIEVDMSHVPQELNSEKIMIGPPVLTRFEKARIMGSRALQLSQGAPPFIPIPETANTSLDIAMEELEKKVIPIVIKRVLPNKDYQNIPIGIFK